MSVCNTWVCRGSALRGGLDRIYESFGEKHGKLRKARSTLATGDWSWHVLSTILERWSAPSLVGAKSLKDSGDTHACAMSYSDLRCLIMYWEIHTVLCFILFKFIFILLCFFYIYKNLCDFAWLKIQFKQFSPGGDPRETFKSKSFNVTQKINSFEKLKKHLLFKSNNSFNEKLMCMLRIMQKAIVQNPRIIRTFKSIIRT